MFFGRQRSGLGRTLRGTTESSLTLGTNSADPIAAESQFGSDHSEAGGTKFGETLIF